MPNDKFLSFTHERIRAIIIWGAITGIFSTIVYFGANEIASRSTHFYKLYLDFERDIARHKISKSSEKEYLTFKIDRMQKFNSFFQNSNFEKNEIRIF